MDQQQSSDNGIDLKHVFYVLQKYRWAILSIFFIGFLIAFLFVRYTRPVYEANMIIQLNDETETNFLWENSPSMLMNKGLARDMELLKSPVLLKRTLDSLNLSTSFFNKGVFVDNDIYQGSVFDVNVIYASPAIFEIPIFIAEVNQLVSLDYKINNESFHVKGAYDSLITTAHFSLKIGKKRASDLVSEDNVVFFKINNSNVQFSQYASALSINVLNEFAKTISISLKDPNYFRAKDIIEQLAIQFGHLNIEMKQEGYNRVINYIDKTLLILKDQLFELDSSLSVYKKMGVIAATNNDEFNSFRVQKNNELISSFEYKKLEAELELSMLNEVLEKVNELNASGKEIADLIPFVTQLKGQNYVQHSLTKLSGLLSQKQLLEGKVTEQNRSYLELKSQIDYERNLLVKSLEASKSMLLRNIQDYKNRIASFQMELLGSNKDVPFEKELELSQLKRLFEVNSKYYEELQQRKMEFLLLKESYVPNYRILQYPADNSSFIFPRKDVILGGTLLICLFLSVVFIFVIYFLHDTILFVEDIEKVTPISFLGEVSKLSDEMPFSKIVVRDKPKGKIAEEFRKIRYNLEFITNKKGPKIISLTSSVSGEGKTFVSLNLAEVLSAVDNSRVIIIDADMRKPKIHLAMGMSNEAGLSTLLIQKSELANSIHKTENPSLDVITSGPTPPNPSELLLSHQMQDLIEALKKNYEYIIFDNPPIGIVADAISTLKIADFPIYIFRAEYSKFKYINILKSLKNNHKIDAMSIILNNVSNEHSSYGTHYQSYGYYEEDTGARKRRKLKKLLNRKK